MNDTTQPAGVEIDPATLRWVGSGFKGCFLTFAPRSEFESAPSVSAVERAIAAADLKTAGEDPVRVAAVVEGTDALYIRVHYGAANRKEVREWVTDLGRALSAATLCGTLRRPIPRYPEHWVSSGGVYDHAVSVLYALRDPIDKSTVERLAIAHRLDKFTHHTLSGGSEFTFPVRYNRQLTAAIPAVEDVLRLTSWGDHPSDQAVIRSSLRTATGWTHVGDRQAQADRARAALLELAGDVDHAFAEVTKGPGGFHRPLQRPPEAISSSAYIQNPQLWPRRVFDAHGLQILTADHLERADNLDEWRTQQVGDRYLVEARNIDPWFGPEEPDDQLLDRARADFGEMILTATEWRAHKAAEREKRIQAKEASLPAGGETD